jgi:hypothetical protein
MRYAGDMEFTDLLVGILLALGAAGLLFRLWIVFVRSTKPPQEWPWAKREKKDVPLHPKEKLIQEQRQALEALRELVKRTQADVWEAFETSYMSDAKSAVYSLKEAVSSSEDLPHSVRTTLAPIADEAWRAIVGIESTADRAQKSHAKLGILEREIDQIIAGET